MQQEDNSSRSPCHDSLNISFKKKNHLPSLMVHPRPGGPFYPRKRNHRVSFELHSSFPRERREGNANYVRYGDLFFLTIVDSNNEKKTKTKFKKKREKRKNEHCCRIDRVMPIPISWRSISFSSNVSLFLFPSTPMSPSFDSCATAVCGYQ